MLKICLTPQLRGDEWQGHPDESDFLLWKDRFEDKPLFRTLCCSICDSEKEEEENKTVILEFNSNLICN